MAIAYFNYPNTHITLHRDPNCGYIRMHNSPDSRIFHLRPATLSDELRRFSERQVDFAAAKGINDMCLDLEFADPEFELALVRHIQKILSERYSPFGRVEVQIHCG